FAVMSGTLPPGLTLASSGILSGTPTATGIYFFTVSATDSSTPTDTGQQGYTVTMNPVLALTNPTLPDWTANFSGYSETITASGGNGSYTFSSTGTLATGLTLTTAGVLSGTPTTTGRFTFTVTAADSLGGNAIQSYTVTINPPVSLTTATLASGDFGAA